MTVTRRALLGGVAAVAIAPSATGTLAGCAAVAPAVGTWLSEFALGLSVDAAIEVLKYGAKVGVEGWEEKFSARVPDAWHMRKGFYRSSIAAALLVAVAATESAFETPALCDVVVIVKKGDSAVRLPSWAWFTMSSFGNDYLAHGGKGGRNARAALLGYALTPSGSREKRVRAPHKLVASVSYTTAIGRYVEVGKVEQEDHTFSGYIKVSGIPDASNRPTVAMVPLPEGF